MAARSPAALSIGLCAYGLSERLWGLQPQRIEANELIDRIAALVDEAIADEREACARLVEEEGPCRHVDHVQDFCACREKAAAIRARGAVS